MPKNRRFSSYVKPKVSLVKQGGQKFKSLFDQFFFHDCSHIMGKLKCKCYFVTGAKLRCRVKWLKVLEGGKIIVEVSENKRKI